MKTPEKLLKNSTIALFFNPCFHIHSLAKETPPLISADGGSFDHHDIPNLEYTTLFTTLLDLLHVIENVGEEHEGRIWLKISDTEFSTYQLWKFQNSWTYIFLLQIIQVCYVFNIPWLLF